LTYFELDDLINDYEVTTLSGLIMTELSHIPKQGEKLIWQKFELEVIDMDGVMIDKVLVKSLKD
jgi:putative hemolysin